LAKALLQSFVPPYVKKQKIVKLKCKMLMTELEE